MDGRGLCRTRSRAQSRPSDKVRERRAREDAAFAAYQAEWEPRLLAALDDAPPVAYVYFVAPLDSEGPVKIGLTGGDPARRLATLEAGSPVPLRLAGALAGTAAVERGLHARFAHLRDRREWFRAGPDLLVFIAAEAIAPGPDFARRLSVASRDERARIEAEIRSAILPPRVKIGGLFIERPKEAGPPSNHSRFGVR